MSANGIYTIWSPSSPSEHAPRIRLDKIVATEWRYNENTHCLWVHLDGMHSIKLSAKEGNELLDDWAIHVDNRRDK